MSFQITDIPRILPELMLLLLGLLVLGSDILTRWGRGAQAQAERAREAGQLTAVGLGLVFVVGLVQSRFLFTVPDPTGGPLDVLLTLGRNLQAGGPFSTGLFPRGAASGVSVEKWRWVRFRRLHPEKRNGIAPFFPIPSRPMESFCPVGSLTWD